MINKIQRMLYKVSCIAPICVVLSFLFSTQGMNILFCIFVGLVGVGGCVYAFIFIKLCEKKLPVLMITVNSISQEDSSVIPCVVAYIVPLIGIIWKDNLVIWVIIAVGLILIMIKVNNLSFCPILLLANYHCYKASLTTGTECILISRKKGVRNSGQINQVMWISDTLMLEKTGGNTNV